MAAQMIEVHCPKCKTLLFKVEGLGSKIEIHCKRCDILVQWPSLKPEIAPHPVPEKKRRVFE